LRIEDSEARRAAQTHPPGYACHCGISR